MFTPFAVEAPIFGLYKLFKAEVEAIGWRYCEEHTPFEKKYLKEMRYAFYFGEINTSGYPAKQGFAFSGISGAKYPVFTLPQQWNEAIAYAQQQYNLLTGVVEVKPNNGFEPFNQPSDLERGDLVKLKDGTGTGWVVESVIMDLAFLVATQTLNNADEWERLKKPAAAPADGWQPIETVPKDGTWVLRPVAPAFQDGQNPIECITWDAKYIGWKINRRWHAEESRYLPLWMPAPTVGGHRPQ